MINLLPQPADVPDTEAGRAKARVCQVFAWIGQPFESCDNCGRPLWEHLYHPPYGGARPILYVRQWNRWNGYHWAPVGSLVKPDEGKRAPKARLVGRSPFPRKGRRW